MTRTYTLKQKVAARERRQRFDVRRHRSDARAEHFGTLSDDERWAVAHYRAEGVATQVAIREAALARANTEYDLLMPEAPMRYQGTDVLRLSHDRDVLTDLEGPYTIDGLAGLCEAVEHHERHDVELLVAGAQRAGLDISDEVDEVDTVADLIELLGILGYEVDRGSSGTFRVARAQPRA